MISEVFGKVNNQDIIFHKVEGNRWETIIPRSLSGTYYIDLYARDEAGNVAYMATAIMEFDVDNLRFEFKITNYNDKKLIKEFISEMNFINIKVEENLCNIEPKTKGSDYECVLLEEKSEI